MGSSVAEAEAAARVEAAEYGTGAVLSYLGWGGLLDEEVFPERRSCDMLLSQRWNGSAMLDGALPLPAKESEWGDGGAPAARAEKRDILMLRMLQDADAADALRC